eukprot:COSAG02_NODE_2140_length_9686_cov_7.536664_6_plen_81_part_00
MIALKTTHCDEIHCCHKIRDEEWVSVECYDAIKAPLLNHNDLSSCAPVLILVPQRVDSTNVCAPTEVGPTALGRVPVIDC